MTKALTPKRVTVLRELADLDSGPWPWAREAHGGYWMPYHVRFFRGAGRTGVHEHRPSWVYEAGMSIDAAAAHLRKLAEAGLVDQRRERGSRAEYRINDAGREALAEWDRSHVAD